MSNFDFFKVSTRLGQKGVIEIYPKFFMTKSSDLMIRGGDFYAIWVEERGLWSTDEGDLIRLIDRELDQYAAEYKEKFDSDAKVRPLYLRDVETGMIDRWRKYCQKQLRDNFVMLDNKLIFSNETVTKNDYASKRLPYPLQDGPHDAYDKLMSTLYSPDERRKIEWAIGAVVSGDSVKIQKFMVLYGAAGTGKSTVLNIIQQLFEGYYATFDSKALGSSNNAFALEAFRSNPLVAIEHDGDFSKIEDNTKINSLVSHELMTVNEKFKSIYSNRFRSFLFMGTNKPVRITDAKSGLIRRLIDVSPTGEKVPISEYRQLVKQVSFELGPIAKHCLDVYLEDPGYYDNYIPLSMMSASNDFYNFVESSYFIFKENDGTSLRSAWDLYRAYCDDAKVAYPYSMRIFKEELKNYFKEYTDRGVATDGTRVRSYYSGFRLDRFESGGTSPPQPPASWIIFEDRPSILDEVCASCKAQYASTKETPAKRWDEVETTLAELDTSKIHYVMLPEDHIVIDFDLKDAEGKKSPSKNLAEASKWPPTYAELSKSGAGIHLHYFYKGGDPSKLKRLYSEDIEIKVFSGKSSLRRKLTKCNNLPIATISSGLPLKGETKPMINSTIVRSEEGLRRQIERNLAREIWPNTRPSIDMIKHILDEAYESGTHYDLSDMRNAVLGFATQSTHQAEYCVKTVAKMKFRSEDASDPLPDTDAEKEPLVIFDCEVYPNLFVVCWKRYGAGNPVIKMFNPTPEEIDKLFRFRLVGFNNRKYDNHILYARHLGYSIHDLYNLSKAIIDGFRRDCLFREAYNLSYADIYDFSSKKQSLKKFEIDLGIHHLELDIPWNKPVPEERWEEVAQYCENDVLATEAVFDARKADFAARKILAAIAKGTVNDTTNKLSAQFIFEGNKNPQDQFQYRDLGKMPDKVYRSKIDASKGIIFNNFGDEYTLFDEQGRPVFKGYCKSYDSVANRTLYIYRGEEINLGGYVYAEPGIYYNVALLDIRSMHPSSAIEENVFGDYYTNRFSQIVDARVAIKEKNLDKAKTLLNGVLAPYLDDPELVAGLAGALKIVINSVYGESYSKHKNPFRDPRNTDNIIAKRGALFMVNLKHEVWKQGFTVAHIKTDSIKIPNATPEIIQFVKDYGEQYGYYFEHEATYERMCLVNDAVYIAKYDTAEAAQQKYGYIPSDLKKHGGEWTATGTQFQVPYVFKKLFTHEPIEFKDCCEAKTVTTYMVLDMNEGLQDDQHQYKFVGKVGSFCPIKRGCYGGELLRVAENPDTGELTYSAVVGTKGYRWLESEYVATRNRQDDIDLTYYDKLVDGAIDSISKYGDFEMFVSDTVPYPWVPDNEIPFDITKEN